MGTVRPTSCSSRTWPTASNAVWADGALVRLDARDLDAPRQAETLDLTPEPGVTVTAVCQMIGATTLVVGDSAGRVRAWFPGATPWRSRADRPDCGHRAAGAVRARDGARELGAQPRCSLPAYADGAVVIGHMTTGRSLAELATGSAPVEALALSPGNAALLALAQATSTAGAWPSRTPRPRQARVPARLVRGRQPSQAHLAVGRRLGRLRAQARHVAARVRTLKASFYSLLFSVPIALLAAIYTSEFLSRGVRHGSSR
jgi:phosphate transport system permease protein